MKIILGKSKTGKSTKIYEYIEEDIKNKKNPILFVPSQTREITELNYMKQTKKDGIINVNITTINEFISLMLKKKNIHFEENYISKLDKKLILSSVINENKDKLRVFKNVKQKDGFFDLVNMYIDIFRKNNIENEEIKKIRLSNKITEEKLDEISFIYSKYKEKVDDKYIDNITEINIFNENIKLYEKEFENTTIYFDGYNNFTKLELNYIKALLAMGLEITIAINTDITCMEDVYSKNTNDIFEIPNKTYLKLLNIASSLNNVSVENIVLYNSYLDANKSIEYLAENIFEPVKNKISIEDDNVSLNVYSNVYKEVEAIAYNISKRIKDGYRYNDFCIYTTDISNYESVFSRIFYEYNIPIYVDTKRKIETSRLVEYILELMEMTTLNINLENIMNILKKGLNDFDLEDLSYLENYILEFNINKYNIKNKLYLNNQKNTDNIYDMDIINDIRDRAIDIFFDTVSKLKTADNTKQIITIIYEHLLNNNIFFNYYNLSGHIDDKKYFLYSSKNDSLIWDKVSEIFNSIDKIYGNSNINIIEFYKLFKMVISDVYVKSTPPTKDKVILADINVSKLDYKKIVFLVGVIDGSFPKKYDEDILFNDDEIEELNKHDIDFKETSISKENMGKYNIYEVLNNVKEKLFVTMPAVDIKNEVTRKSNIISDIEDTLNIKLLGEVSGTNDLKIKYDDIYSSEKCFEYMTKTVRYIISDLENIKNDKESIFKIREILNIYEYFIKNEKYSELMSYLKKDDNLSKKSIDLIYKDEFKSSVYKLEQFKKCPFSYFMKYVLNVDKRKVYEITSMDTGSLMHSVIDEFTNYLIENNVTWKEIIDENELLIDKYNEKIISIIDELLKNEFKKQKESIKYHIYKKKLQNTMVKVILVVAKSFRQSDFEVLGNEIEFNDKSVYLPIVLELDNNTKMKIIGKIDRVDILNKDDKSYLRVVDYKSSNKNLKIDDIKEGISLQLITYITAILESFDKSKEAIPAACLYFNLSDKLINLKDYTNDEIIIKNELIKKLRLNGIFIKDIEILQNMDKYVNDPSKKLIDITPSRMSNSNKALEEKEFKNLCNETKEILKGIGNEMIKGVVKIKTCNKDVCKFCDFSSICRKDISL